MAVVAGHLAFPRGDARAAARTGEALAHRGQPGSGVEAGPIALAGGVRRGELCVASDGVDPEKVLDLWSQHGEAMLPKLRGGFALALWDGRTLLLARDGFGRKPLVYCHHQGALWFASEAQALKSGGAPLGHVDRGALSDYLELLYVPAPGSIWNGLRRLPAGYLLRAGENGVEARQWFEPPVPGSSPKRPSRIAVRARLEEAVRAEADPRASILLSGGLDSSALVALTTRQLGRVRTFATDFGEDLGFARKIAARFRTDHHELVIKPVDEVPQALRACGEPFGDAALLNSAALFRAVSRESKLVMTGDGAAELFAGRAHHLRASQLPHSERAARAADLLRSIAPRKHRGKLQRAAGALGSTGPSRARALVEVFSIDERRALMGEAARAAPGATAQHAQFADAALAFDLEYALPDDVLFRLDAASMRFGVEARTPYLDAELARMVVPPPTRFKLGRSVGSKLLRDAVADLLPREVLLRAPVGIPAPVGTWLRGPLRNMLHDLVRAPSARIRLLLDPRAVDEVLKHSLAPRGDARQAWALFALEIWAREQRG
jgi:asparagine synthase (glutamine-hydrolysing)